MSFHYCLLFFIISTFFPVGLAQNGSLPCPLTFAILQPILPTTWSPLRSLRLLRRTGSFVPPLNSSESCWQSYQSLIPNFNIRSSCGFETAWISQGCMDLTTKADFEALIPNATLTDVVSNCNQSLRGTACASCTSSLANLLALYLTNSSIASISDCVAYPSIYAGASAIYFGATDTAICLFSLDIPVPDTSNGEGEKQGVSLGVLISVGVVGLAVFIGGPWFVYRKYRDSRKKRRDRIGNLENHSGLDSINETIDFNFSTDSIIGKGRYGNVYKGYLPDGSEVALKRFKSCSAAGDAEFAHEVKVIASIRHVNLVALRGYCTATIPLEGHQRIIVCDLMKNGSLHDHFFGSTKGRLTCPVRQKIALGTARGLAYLHYGAQPAIIHKDIKASNILLDDMFEARVADFGLAKFALEGMTHLSTRVAGTMGYIAPEYALYGQLTDRSDVYSFGVVLHELLSRKKAFTMSDENQPSVLADWVWSLVKNEKALDIIEGGMPELGSPEVMEKYVLIAVLCSHPELQCRPSMDQVVKMLETDISVPSIPDRSIPTVAIDEIDRSIRNLDSGCQKGRTSSGSKLEVPHKLNSK
ncbi:hypothetical protein E1A91_D08G224900v1 [Gossypium mustelinum]|uniref:non-specific serine/threonine protein kinase n=1 Tax=Gossypium mustelinum TaxID=34275 RepID=A0A5D2TZB6_GOSMU|nr:hypothetical protein E1A91_D08G224900v1 [Gossypium mustelinum]